MASQSRCSVRHFFQTAIVWASLGLLCATCATAQDLAHDAPVGASYPDAEAAFTAVFVTSGLGLYGYLQDREYAAAIYQTPDGNWHCTNVVAGTQFGSAIPYHAVPAQAVRIVGAHTHGWPHIPEDPDHLYGLDFSEVDRVNALQNYRITHGKIAGQLLLNSELKILRMTLSGYAYGPGEGELVLRPGIDRIEVLGQMSVPINDRQAAFFQSLASDAP